MTIKKQNKFFRIKQTIKYIKIEGSIRSGTAASEKNNQSEDGVDFHRQVSDPAWTSRYTSPSLLFNNSTFTLDTNKLFRNLCVNIMNHTSKTIHL
jgi:hypothetical protein